MIFLISVVSKNRKAKSHLFLKSLVEFWWFVLKKADLFSQPWNNCQTSLWCTRCKNYNDENCLHLSVTYRTCVSEHYDVPVKSLRFRNTCNYSGWPFHFWRLEARLLSTEWEFLVLYPPGRARAVKTGVMVWTGWFTVCRFNVQGAKISLRNWEPEALSPDWDGFITLKICAS